MIAWDWFYSLACECIDGANGDEHRGVELMVDRLMAGSIPREVWEDECRAYINTAAIRDGAKCREEALMRHKAQTYPHGTQAPTHGRPLSKGENKQRLKARTTT
jgi:hypothetical protein